MTWLISFIPAYMTKLLYSKGEVRVMVHLYHFFKDENQIIHALYISSLTLCV